MQYLGLHCVINDRPTGSTVRQISKALLVALQIVWLVRATYFSVRAQRSFPKELKEGALNHAGLSVCKSNAEAGKGMRTCVCSTPRCVYSDRARRRHAPRLPSRCGNFRASRASLCFNFGVSHGFWILFHRTCGCAKSRVGRRSLIFVPIKYSEPGVIINPT